MNAGKFELLFAVLWAAFLFLGWALLFQGWAQTPAAPDKPAPAPAQEEVPLDEVTKITFQSNLAKVNEAAEALSKAQGELQSAIRRLTDSQLAIDAAERKVNEATAEAQGAYNRFMKSTGRNKNEWNLDSTRMVITRKPKPAPEPAAEQKKP